MEPLPKSNMMFALLGGDTICLSPKPSEARCFRTVPTSRELTYTQRVMCQALTRNQPPPTPQIGLADLRQTSQFDPSNVIGTYTSLSKSDCQKASLFRDTWSFFSTRGNSHPGNPQDFQARARSPSNPILVDTLLWWEAPDLAKAAFQRILNTKVERNLDSAPLFNEQSKLERAPS